MERKTLLAIAVSFLFLMVYNSFVIAPQQKAKTENIAQSFENNKLALDVPLAPEELKDDDKSVEIGLFKIRFSASQGTIKEIRSTTYNYSPILGNIFDFTKNATLNSFSSTQNTLVFNIEDENYHIEKRIKAIDKNRLEFEVKLSNVSNLNNVQFSVFDIDAHRIKSNKNVMRDAMLSEYSFYIDNKVVRKNNATKFSSKDQKTEEKSPEWFEWRDRYHFALLKPEFHVKSYSKNYVDDHRLMVSASAENTQKNFKGEETYVANFYVGPQDLQLLENLDGNLHKIMAFSGNPLLDAIEKFIYKTLLFMNKYIHNWGVCIILISLLIYGATYPLTIKSMMSMRKMQELQPKMAELREKYKNDPQKLNTEVVQLYKIHNVNPLAGCLPMLLQMPIFISLYQVLWRTHNFESAKFLWIKDLSMPDRLFIIPQELPFIGNEINILPFFMMAVMFFQQQLSSKSMVVTDPSQEMQQKMMKYIFPVFIGGIFYHFASGLTLYFTIFYLLSTLTQYKMSKLGPVNK